MNMVMFHYPVTSCKWYHPFRNEDGLQLATVSDGTVAADGVSWGRLNAAQSPARHRLRM